MKASVVVLDCLKTGFAPPAFKLTPEILLPSLSLLSPRIAYSPHLATLNAGMSSCREVVSGESTQGRPENEVSRGQAACRATRIMGCAAR